MIKDILGSLPGCVGEATTMLIIFSGLSGIKEKNAQGSNESLCSRKMVVYASFSDDS